MPSLILRSPAKINLFLKVVSKRPDGYHNLKTLFERIDLCDRIRLTINKSSEIRVNCSHPALRQTKENLVYRAAMLLKERFKVGQGVEIDLVKQIPVAAGLGGGSGNAATVLLGLNKLWGLKLTLPELAACGRMLGSDVPFFLYGCSWAVGRQRGDRIRPVELPKKLWHVLVVPRLKIYSREVFARLNLQLTKTPDNVNILIRSLSDNNINNVTNLMSNDLENGILLTCPRLAKAKSRMEKLAGKRIIFSGSGPALFSITKNKKEAYLFRDVLRRFYRQVFIVRTL